MARYFASPQGFEFPDKIFPRCSVLETPKTPLELGNVLEAQLGSIVERPLGDRVKWAQSVIHQSELYGSVSRPCVASALSLVEGAATSNGLASYLVGNWSLFGLFGKPRDKETAKKYYKQAIKLHYSRGWYRMGVSAEEKRDFDVAVSRYESGASLRDSACLYRLAVALLKGQLGFQQDHERALALFELACDNADEDFCQPLYLFGLMLLGEVEGGGQALNKGRGLDLISRAAALHFAPALVRMANAYQHSERPYDYTAVLSYLHCAVRQERHAVYLNRGPSFAGNVEAQLTKVLLCGSPPAFAPNEEWAYKFAAASADLGNSTAQFALGYFEEVGIWVKPNPEQAQEMYKKSAANNCEAAKQRIASLKTPLKRSNSLTRRDHEVAVHRQLSRGERKEERADRIVMRMVGDKGPEKPPYPEIPSALGLPPAGSALTGPVLPPSEHSDPSSSDPIFVPASSSTHAPRMTRSPARALEASPALTKLPYPSASPAASPAASPPPGGLPGSLESSRASVVLPSPSTTNSTPYPSSPPRSVSYKVSSAAGYPVTPTHGRSKSMSPERVNAPVTMAVPVVPEIRECSPGIAELDLEPSVSPERPMASPGSPSGSPGASPSAKGSHSRSSSRSPSPSRRSPRALLSKFRSKFGRMDTGSNSSLASFVSLDAPSLPPQVSLGHPQPQGQAQTTPEPSGLSSSPPSAFQGPFTEPAPALTKAHTFDQAPRQSSPVRYFTPPPAAWGTKVNRKPASNGSSAGPASPVEKSSSASPVGASPVRGASANHSSGSASTGPVIAPRASAQELAPAPAHAPGPGSTPASSVPSVPENAPVPTPISLSARTPSPQRPTPYPQDTPTELKRMSATSVRRPRHKHTQSSVVRPSASSASVAAPKRNFSTPAEPPKQFTSFDQMGIQIVTEDKAGPCVIA